jgi:two-component system response regulator
LLDLNLPDLDGLEVLEFLKKDANLKTIPIVIFSTLASDETKNKAYALYANSFVLKPSELSKFRPVIKAIVAYWSQVCAYS